MYGKLTYPFPTIGFSLIQRQSACKRDRIAPFPTIGILLIQRQSASNRDQIATCCRCCCCCCCCCCLLDFRLEPRPSPAITPLTIPNRRSLTFGTSYFNKIVCSCFYYGCFETITHQTISESVLRYGIWKKNLVYKEWCLCNFTRYFIIKVYMRLNWNISQMYPSM